MIFYPLSTKLMTWRILRVAVANLAAKSCPEIEMLAIIIVIKIRIQEVPSMASIHLTLAQRTILQFLSTQTLESHLGIWFEKLFLKKFQDSCPSTENIAIMFAESTPSLKNLRPMPGDVVFVPVSGSTARENL